MQHTGRLGALLVATALVTLLSTAATPAARAPTADQQLVSGLESARSGARQALRSLARPSSRSVAQATVQLRQVTASLGRASRAAPRAVGALDTPSVRAVLQQAAGLTRRAREDVKSGRYAFGRAALRSTIGLTGEALGDFGLPLEKEFASYAVHRDFSYLPEFADYSGLSATVGSEISEVVIGAADRRTANAGEPGGIVAEAGGLPITRISVAVISDPIGRFTSGWCELTAGVITCRIRPAMPTDRIFTIAFGPRLPPATKLLVKFRTADGDRSYAVYTTR